MATFSYEDFQRELNASGLAGEFSEADMQLAMANPDAGMSILNYKKDWHNATTDEARALANAGAEQVRSNYGNYTAGTSGGNYYITPPSPNDFSYGSAPTYTSRYDDQINEILQSAVNTPAFSYDPESDELYSAYRKQYAREGDRATAEALGQASAMTGGLPSSSAVTAAAQAGNYYAAQMTDKIPELYELAYNKYLNDYNMKLSNLAAVQGVEQVDYNRYLTSLDQYNADRNFSYGQLMDEISAQNLAAQQKLENAQIAANYGDYSQLNDMGISTDNYLAEWEKQYNMAVLAAEYGDFSGLQALGIDTSEYEAAYQAGLYGGGDDDAQLSPEEQIFENYLDEVVFATYPGGRVTDPEDWAEYVRQFGREKLNARNVYGLIDQSVIDWVESINSERIVPDAVWQELISLYSPEQLNEVGIRRRSLLATDTDSGYAGNLTNEELALIYAERNKGAR